MRKIAAAVCLAGLAVLLLSGRIGAQSKFDHFITVRGDRLMDGDRPFRFISFNVPNLLLVEDNMAFTQTNPWRLPERFELEDALRSVLQAGGTVVRTYTISVARPDDDPGTPKHVLGPGKFSERAFLAMDTVLAAANRLGVRLIIPLVDNWKWMGGRPQYAAFRNKEPDDFWTDPQLRADFKETIAYVVNRTNTVTGVPYREDKAILAWELGNELRGCPAAWAEEMAAYLKKLDPNHLVADGVQARTLEDWALRSRSIDLVSTHHYERNADKMLENIGRAARLARGKKPYYLGEFGFIPAGGVQRVLEAVLHTPNIAGALIWSLRFHSRDGGFYWHSEPSGGGLYRAYHWPGFRSGIPYGEPEVLAVLARFAWGIQDKPVPSPPVPAAPRLLAVTGPGQIRWQGVPGAEAYVVERAESPGRPWRALGPAVSDAAAAYVPLFCDATAEPGRTYFYRVRAVSAGEISPASNVVGPVSFRYRAFVDDFQNLQRIYAFGGPLRLDSSSPRAFKEDFHRLRMDAGGWIRYWLPGAVRRVSIFAFGERAPLGLTVRTSRSGKEYTPARTEQHGYPMNRRDYPYRLPVLIEVKNIPAGSRMVEIRAEETLQLGRVEIRYE